MKFKRTIIVVLALIFFSSNFCFSQKNKIDPEFKIFWKEFSSAVQKGDKERVAEMVNFPIVNENDDNIKLSKSEFLKFYSIVISPAIGEINSLKRIDYFDDNYDYEDWYSGTSERCEYRLNFTKINGKYKAVSVYILEYDFDNWNEKFATEIALTDFRNFLYEFKAALKKKDKNKISDMIQFPNNSLLNASDQCKTETKEQFLKCYDEIFFKNLVSSIQKSGIDENTIRSSKSDFQEQNSGELEYVIMAYPATKIMNGQFEYRLYFTKINGQILLFKIESEHVGN